MINEFCPYEIALALQELDFDEECFGFYNNADGSVWVKHTIDESIKNIYTGDFEAPTYSQAFKFFREKYNIEHNNRPAKKFDTDKAREISFYIDGNFMFNLRFTTDKTFEEAELECLKKLIEIVKNK